MPHGDRNYVAAITRAYFGRSLVSATPEHQALQAPGFGWEKMPEINTISFETVIEKLIEMKPVVFSYAEKMKGNRLRLSWRTVQ